ncbi:MAG: hypothetical protein GF364_01780 [Candidatus Lokiarchaeota archaeon]|nr:hypothetical protein [Candidatus Lokiarchaeota archaeon]
MALFDFLTDIITNPFFIVSAIFWIIAYTIRKISGEKKDTVSMLFPFFAMFRTRKLNEWLSKIGKKYQKFWRIWFTVGIFVSFGLMIYGVYFFLNNLIELFIAPKPENAIQPLIPGVTVDLNFFSYLILPLGFCIIFHEFSHAMTSECDKIKLKSTGIIGAGLFYIILPGAFVEPDEYTINSRKTSIWTRLRIFTSGTYTNAIQAGLCLLLFVNFPLIISPLYGPQVFKIEGVVATEDGGYNEGNIFIGDVVIEINQTDIDLSKGIGLTQVLNNETSIKCSVGDTLNLSVIDKSESQQQRIIKLGHHFFVGFDYTYSNATTLKITEVYTKYQGGNNYEFLTAGMQLKAIGSYFFNTTEDKTLGMYLKENAVEGKVNVTLLNDNNISIYIDYWPTEFGAYAFRNFFIGAFFKNDSNGNVFVDRVLSDLTEDGINDDNLFKGDQITHVNGVEVEITAEISFEEFLISIVPEIEEMTQITFTVIPKNAENPVNRLVNIKPIEKSYVFIGVQSNSYWIPKNWFSSLLGSGFARWVELELFYFYMVGFSLALFNMVPMILPPLDGYLLFKELVSAAIGSKYKNKKRKKIKFAFERNTANYRLMTYNITEIVNLKMELPSGKDPELFDEPLYRGVDSIEDGYIDTISFDLESTKLPPENTSFIADVEYLEDEKAKLKKRITYSVGIMISALIIMNFIFSYVFVGNITFWL